MKPFSKEMHKDGFCRLFPKKSSSEQWGYFLGEDLPLKGKDAGGSAVLEGCM